MTMTTRSRALTYAAATLASTALAITATSGPASAETIDFGQPGVAGFTVNGHGWGHGHGLSQYGARGAASQGQDWKQIVGFYYPGTRLGKAGGTIKVLLTDATKKTLVVEAQKGLRLKQVGKKKSWKVDKLRPKATAWRITPKAGKAVVTYKVAQGWRRFAVIKGDAEFSAGTFPVTLRVPGHGKTQYRGALRSVDRQTVNVLPLDQYVMGVVPQEMPASWAAQAVRAQAVAARTYAAYERDHAAGAAYDTCDTDACQVYGGYGAEQPASNQEVRKTRHRVVVYQGEPAFTQFSSSNGGQSSAGSMPYLVAQADPWEQYGENPKATWGPVHYSRQEIEAEWPEVGTLQRIDLTREGNGDYGGWITSVTLTGSAGTKVVPGGTFSYTLGLYSAYFGTQPASQKQLTDALVTRLVPWGA
jgi:stage II sporulation protein D